MEEAKEKSIQYYSSSHKILLVGEGDLSFAVCLAKAFGSAVNIVATTLDSQEMVLAQYSRASENLKALEELGCTIIHKVNSHTMSEHPLLRAQLFDRIAFNFPHAGFQFGEYSLLQIEQHRNLVRGFFKSASSMLAKKGEVHMIHKTTYPFSTWNVVDLAMQFDLSLVREEAFVLGMYPGYINKRGEGWRCDCSFPVGLSSTFMFALR
ncbi:hypothetical protein MLD38_034280 [Melastoma candidum]|uniref:Uncharacterized protein n=1 Tax=Melastoma candidum TaxID=119954 RepID=A0ACB9MD71_9MYRT|nr:hypothetical protein MLD38_034280 [Melastoma candidum]